jgi:histidinol-phosphate aminotransferase
MEQAVTVSIKPAFRDCLIPLRPYVPGGTTEDVACKYAPQRISKMGSNENPLGPGPMAMEAVKNQLGNLSVYPDVSCAELRSTLAAETGKQPGNFFVGNGSDEVLQLIAATYLNPGDGVLVSTHTFFQYEFIARIFDAEVRTVPTRELAYDLPGFLAAVDGRTKMVFLCNPNNPTGLYFTHSGLSALLSAMPKSVLVVIDEAYVEYVDAGDFPDTVALMEAFPNLVVTRTFSKAYGLAALRVGYAIAADWIIKDLMRVKMPFNVNQLAQKAAVAALGDKEHLNRTTWLNGDGRKSLARSLERLGCRVLPSQGNFLCFEPPRPVAAVCEYLSRQGVIVRPLSRFGLDTGIRVTVGTLAQNAHFLEAMTAVLAAL